MDKYEYKIRTEEIKTLITKGRYAEAVEIADGIDWRRVKSVMMLCTISDLYKVNRRYEDSRDLLLLAYDRHPGGRSIVYSLCELSIKMGEFVQAIEYYKEFVQIAPKDNGRYVLQYKLYEAQDVSLEERIEVLEELKSKEYVEKWAYELAYLYHRVGLATKCVEECDELILWFGEGKYVMKAMELKMLHEPLTLFQQEKYDFAKGLRRGVVSEEEQKIEIETSTGKVLDAPTLEMPSKELDIQVKVMGVGQYDTINMQKELAEHMKELWEGTEEKDENGEVSQNTRVAFAREIKEVQEMTEISMPEQAEQETADAEENSLAEETEDTIAEEEVIIDSESDEETEDESEEESVDQTVTETEVFFGETGDMDKTASLVMEAMRNEATGVVTEEAIEDEENVPGQMSFGMDIGTGDMKEIRTVGDAVELAQAVEEEKPKELRRTYEKILGMEYDGQISMLLPESEQVEKQITGQISLEDVLRELEKRQKESEQKFRENVEQRVLQQTGAMFTEFEAAIRDGLLEQLEREKNTDTISFDDYTAEDEVQEELEEVEELAEIEEAEEVFLPEDSEELSELDTFDMEGSDEEEFVEELAEEEPAEEEPAEEEPAEEEPAEEELAEEEPAEEEPAEEEPAEEEPAEEEPAEEEPAEEEPAEEEPAEEEPAEEEPAEEEPVEEEPVEEEPAEEEPVEEEPVEEEPVEEEPAEEEPAEEEHARVETEEGKLRPMSPEEQELFGSYAYSQKSKEQIINAIDNISMASYTGNVIITGDESMDILTLAKNLVKEVQNTDSNFSGKIAKISGASLNQKDIEDIVDKMSNGALIVQKASGMSKDTAAKLCRVLEQEERGVIVLLVDTKKAINGLMKETPSFEEYFTIRIDVEALSNKALVELGTKYARDREYSIDEMGILALHTAIADRQSSDHVVTVQEVQRIIDEAINKANRKTLGHFFDILIAKRYDDEDMIILREKDFV